MQQKAATSHCELQQVITNPFLACHPWQSLFLMLAQVVQEEPPQQAGWLPMSHLETHTDTDSLFLYIKIYVVKNNKKNPIFVFTSSEPIFYHNSTMNTTKGRHNKRQFRDLFMFFIHKNIILVYYSFFKNQWLSIEENWPLRRYKIIKIHIFHSPKHCILTSKRQEYRELTCKFMVFDGHFMCPHSGLFLAMNGR